MFKQLLNDIIHLLPNTFTDNIIFKRTIKELQKLFPNEVDFSTSRLSLSTSIYNYISNRYPIIKDRLYQHDSRESLVYLTLFIDGGLIILRIKDFDRLQKIYFSLTSYNGLTKEIKLTMSQGFSVIESIRKKEENYMITEYDYNIKTFNKKGELQVCDEELEKDLKFSEEFLVPLEEARKYRLNFKDYIEYLNENKIKETSRQEEQNLADYHFRPSLLIDDLEIFIKREMAKDVSMFINFQTDDLRVSGIFSNVINNLKSLIGTNEGIIISENIYNSLVSYLLGQNNRILYNKGIIIKKINGIYTLYYVLLENERITSVAKQLSEKEINLLLQRNVDNQDLEELKTFFGYGHILK